LEQAVGAAAGRINGKYGEVAWTPIRYLNRTYSRSALAGLYRSARAALGTPLRDGMNLVAKEYVAAQDPNDPGVLILSRFAGAAAECQQALLVNPYDAESVAAAIARALDMPVAERRERHSVMLENLAQRKHCLGGTSSSLLAPLNWRAIPLMAPSLAAVLPRPKRPPDTNVMQGEQMLWRSDPP
jgi:trehalose 6-phosphate synthase